MTVIVAGESNEEVIAKLCIMSAANLAVVKSNSKQSGITLARAKELSHHLSLNKCLNKATLIIH